MEHRRIARKMVLSLSVILIGFLASIIFLFNTLNLLKVNGPLYRQIIAGKDLIADILPPPDYIIETYLVAFELRENIGNAAEVQRLTTYVREVLRKQYDERHEYWVRDVLFLADEASIREPMLTGSYNAAQDFYATLETEFLPAVQSGNKALADSILTGTLKDLYEEHRLQIDTVVRLSTEKNLRLEAEAARFEKLNIGLSIAISIIAILICLVLTFMLARSIVRPLHATVAMPENISSGEGDLTRRLTVASKDEISDMAGYFNLTLDKLGNLLRAVKKESENLSTTSTELSASMHATSNAVDAIYASIQSVRLCQ